MQDVMFEVLELGILFTNLTIKYDD